MDKENELDVNRDVAANEAEQAGATGEVDTINEPGRDVQNDNPTGFDGNHFEGDPEIRSILDSLTEERAKEEQAAAEPASETEPKDVVSEKPTDSGTGNVPEKEPQNEEEEEAAILAEVKSDRGKDRIRQMLDERKQLREDQRSVLDLVSQVNVTPAEFAQTMEYNRLVASGDEKSMRLALDMLDAQRDMICKRLGVSAPGVDLLSDFPDLKTAVDEMDMTEERALELATHRRRENQVQEAARMRQADERAYQENAQRLQMLDRQATEWFRTKQGDIDFEAKANRILGIFNDPKQFDTFVSTYAPEQWLPAIKLMYENMIVPSKPPVQVAQPLTSRPRNLGRPNEGMSDRDFILNSLDEMGI